MTEIALALAFVAVLAFVDRMLSRNAAASKAAAANVDRREADHANVELWSLTNDRLRALEGLADRVRELEGAATWPSGDLAALADQLAKAEAKYDAIIKAGINECRNLILSATDPQLRAPMRGAALRAVKGDK